MERRPHSLEVKLDLCGSSEESNLIFELNEAK